MKYQHKIHIKKLYISLVFCSFSLLLFSQDVALAKPSAPIPNLFLPETDSLSNSSAIQRANAFYDSLRSKTSRWKWTKRLYDVAFDSIAGPVNAPNYLMEKWDKQYQKYAGRIIRRITLTEKKVFGLSHGSSSKSLIDVKQYLNKYHAYTKPRIIRQNLLFRSGDKFYPVVFAENERLFFDLPFLQTVRFHITTVGEDSVDVNVITKDALSLGAAAAFPDYNSLRGRIYNENILGLGQKISGTLLFDPKAENFCEFVGATFEIYNIKNSFITGIASYNKNSETEKYDLSLNRSSILARTKATGGLKLGKVERFPEISDSIIVTHRSIEKYLSLGAGIPRYIKSKTDLSIHNFFNYMFSFSNSDFSVRPHVSEDSNRYYYNQTTLLLSLARFKNDYYKTNRIYNFGRVEYVPFGYLFEIMAGPNFNEFNDGIYAGFKFAKAKYFEDIGYFFSKIEAGNFFRKQNFFDEGVINSEVIFFSPLIKYGAFNLRNICHLSYTEGINRDKVENININNENGIRGFEDENLQGAQRLVMDIESILFTPLYFNGFRFALFGFLDMAHIAEKTCNILNEKLYSGFGCGIRIRNEHLVLKTFQIRFGFYPTLNTFKISVSGENVENFGELTTSYPQIIPFR